MCLLLSIFWQHLQSITEDAWQHIYLLTHNTWHSRANACQSLSLFYQHGRTSMFILLLDVSLFHCRLPPPPPPPPFNTPPWHFIKFSKVCTLSTTRVNFLGHKHATMTLAWILNSLYNQTLTWSTRYVMILSLICHQCQLRTSKGWYEVIIHQFFVLKMMI